MKQKEKKPVNVYVADTESVYLSQKDLEELGMKEQTSTEPWLLGLMRAVGPDKIRNEPFFATNNIPEFMDYLEAHVETNSLIYFWNLSWDASFILSYLINEEKYTPAVDIDDYLDNAEKFYDKENHTYVDTKEEGKKYDNFYPKYAKPYDFNYQVCVYKICVSEMNQWYSVTIRTKNMKTFTFLDAAKLCPMPLRDAAGPKGFNCVFEKLEMSYSGLNHRQFGPVKKNELDYFANDLRTASEIVYRMREEFGMTKTTIASCALESLKKFMGPSFKEYFPDLRKYYTGLEKYPRVYDYCRAAYAGGWSYVNPRYQNKVLVTKEGTKLLKNMLKPDYTVVDSVWCADVNSEYPWALHSVSEEDRKEWGHHYYPVGEPTFHTGAPTQDEIDNKCVFLRFKCHFDLKERRFPYIHVRHSNFYKANNCLSTDRVLGKRTLPNGESTAQEFVMCWPDFELFKFTYDIEDLEIYDTVVFEREEGIFDEYIDYWMEKKVEGKKTGNAALVTISKLHLNSIYGRLATSEESNSRYLVTDDDGILRYKVHYAKDKNVVAIAAAAYCTSYARNNVVRAADANYDYFTYSDTDSIHGFSINGHTVQGIKIDKTKLGYWDMEVNGEDNIGLCGVWVKQKTYIECTLDRKTKKVYTNIKAAGMGSLPKELITAGLLASPSIKEPLKIERDGDTYTIPKLYLQDFKPGLKIKNCNPFKKNIKGGCILAKEDASIN